MGIEVSDQVARMECASIFDAKQAAESLHARTELTPTCVGTCRRNSRSGEPLPRNLWPPAGNHFPKVCREFPDVRTNYRELGESEGEWKREFTTDWRSEPGVGYERVRSRRMRCWFDSRLPIGKGGVDGYRNAR
jgi:hypothetical protein